MNNDLEDNLKSEYWEKFKTIFNLNVLPQLSEIEKLRKIKIVQFFVICILVLAGIALSCHFLASIDHTLKTDQAREAAFFTGFIMWVLLFLACTPWVCNLVSKSYARKVKGKIANLIAKAFNVSYEINPNSNYNKYEALLKESELVKNFQYIEVDDLYEGNYEGVKYTFSDTRFKRIAPRGGEVTIYSGIVLHIKTTKPFLGHTEILEKNKFAYNPERTILAFILIVLIVIPLMISVLKENPYMYFLFWKVNFYHVFGLLLIWAFIETFIRRIKAKPNNINISEKTINKNFTLTSTNKEEAKSFISKEFFEKLFELRKTYRTKSIRCAFFEDNIIIIIGTPKDIFEFGTLFKSAYNAESYKTYFREIYPVFKLLHYLKNTSSVSEYLK